VTDTRTALFGFVVRAERFLADHPDSTVDLWLTAFVGTVDYGLALQAATVVRRRHAPPSSRLAVSPRRGRSVAGEW
jgi:hypothetical protein